MKTILVLTDFSDTAFNAVRYAAALTHQLGTSKFILYNSYEYKPIATDMPLPGPSDSASLRAESVKKLELLKNELQSLVSKQTVIEVVTNEIALVPAVESFVRQYHVELTVMGITGKSGFERSLIGSNTISVAKEIFAPLLLIPNEATFEKIHRVVFATDLRNIDQTSPTTEIKAIINALSTKLFILNVDHKELDHLNTDMVTEQTTLHELWDSEDPEYYFTDNQDIAEGIMEFVEQHHIQAVIVIPKKHGFFESLFRRSTTKRLAYHTHIPLLLFQGKDRLNSYDK